MDASDHGLLAGVLAGTMVFLKIIEVLLDRWIESKKNARLEATAALMQPTSPTPLPPEQLLVLRDLLRLTSEIHSTLSVKDVDGLPMVYSSRSNTVVIEQIAKILDKVSDSQERIVRALERYDDRLAVIERAVDVYRISEKQ